MRRYAELQVTGEAEMPFAGAGDWRFEVREDTVKGEVYNTMVEQFGPDPESNSIPFELIRQLDVDL